MNRDAGTLLYDRLMTQTCIMGILNVTPDSFSDGGNYNSTEQAVQRARVMIAEGVDVIDIGGESSRPGSDPVSADNEMERVLPVIEAIRSFSDVPISIDTTKAVVADEALRLGADWVNDISALRFDAQMIDVLKKWNCPVVIMHMQGQPKNMQDNPHYANVVKEVAEFLLERIALIRAHGLERIILDPGIGFGKRLQDNLDIIRHLEEFRKLGYPVLIGPSRKRFIGEITGSPVDQRLAGTLASITWSQLHGATVFRVHDVREAKETVEIVNAIKGRVNQL
jgi:dihydropteroate synthase